MADVEGAVPEAPQPDPLPSSGHAGELTADTDSKNRRTSFHASVLVKDEAHADGEVASPKAFKPTMNISFRKQPSMRDKSQGGTPTGKGSMEVPKPHTSTSAAIQAAQAAINRAKATGAGAPPVEAVVAVERGWHMYGPDHVKPRSEIQISAATKEEALKRKAYRANKDAAAAKRAADEAARKAKEAAALAAAQEAKAAAHAHRVAERRAKYESFMARDKAAAARSDESWKKYLSEKDKAPLLYKTMEEEWRARAAAEEAQRKAAYDEEVARLKLVTYHQIMNGELNNLVPSRSTSPTGGRNSPHGLRGSQELRSSGMLSPGAITRSASPHGGHGYGPKAGSPTTGGGALQWRTSLPQQQQLLERACSPIVFPSDGSTPPGCREMLTYKARQASMQRQQQQEPEVAAFEAEPEQEEEEQEEEGAEPPRAAASRAASVRAAASRAASVKQQQQQEEVGEEEDAVEEQEEQQVVKAPSRGASLHQHPQQPQEQEQQQAEEEDVVEEAAEEVEQQQAAPLLSSSSRKAATRQMSLVKQQEEAPEAFEEELEDATVPAAAEEAPAAAAPAAAAQKEEPAADVVGGEEPAAAVDVTPPAPAKPAEVAAEEAEEAAGVAPAEEVVEAPAKPKAPEPAAEEVDG